MKPDWNESGPKSKLFITINYSQIAELIPEEIVEQDYIIKDFLEHIEYYLTKGNVTEMNDLDLRIMENYSEYSNALEAFKNDIRNKKEELIGEIRKRFAEENKTLIVDWYDNNHSGYGEDDSIYYESVNVHDNLGIGSFRLFRKKWYVKDEYYFYSEIKFTDGLLNDNCIKFQSTLRDYGNKRKSDPQSKEIVRKFKNDSKFGWITEESLDQCKVHKCEKYKISYRIDNKWDDDFIKSSAEKLKEFMDETEELFKKFIDFKK